MILQFALQFVIDESQVIRLCGWRKSPYSNSQGNCVEWSIKAKGVYVRDSKEVARVGEDSAQTLHFTFAEWRAAMSAFKQGLGDLTPVLSSHLPEGEWVRARA